PVKRLPVVQAGAVPTRAELPSLKGLTRVNPWMYVDAKKQHVVIKLIAAATPNNSGFNFDGYAKGHATFVVPLDWNVEFEFSNNAALPHSAAIASNLKVPVKLPIFGVFPAETPNAIAGIGPGVTQLVSLAAVPAG